MTRLPCMVGSSSGELIVAGYRVKVPVLRCLAILILRGGVPSLYALVDPFFRTCHFGSDHSIHSKILFGFLNLLPVGRRFL